MFFIFNEENVRDEAKFLMMYSFEDQITRCNGDIMNEAVPSPCNVGNVFLELVRDGFIIKEDNGYVLANDIIIIYKDEVWAIINPYINYLIIS